MMLYGHARITAVDQQGRSFVNDVSEGDLWLFPPGVPHSIQGLGPDGRQFLLVFDDGDFDEFETFLITDWMTQHTQGRACEKLQSTGIHFRQSAEEGAVHLSNRSSRRSEALRRFDFSTNQMKPNKVTAAGEVKIIDSKNFPVTPNATAIVKLKPGGLCELHWHPNADECNTTSAARDAWESSPLVLAPGRWLFRQTT